MRLARGLAHSLGARERVEGSCRETDPETETVGARSFVREGSRAAANAVEDGRPILILGPTKDLL